ncbi:Disks large-like protein 1 [Frankliniella fusca]|uniref:Disks large-like protein 1 n=1 Tax=Frankliniella fusca TaxID=407009 RepID=A0AAE1HRC3_9NEOP|nr:Disks large-like protein 1 [Frankliniella fusca]
MGQQPSQTGALVSVAARASHRRIHYTPQTSRLPGTTTAPPPSNNNNGPEALSPKAGVTVPAATTPWSLAAMSASSSAAPPAVPLAPTAAALVAPAATPAPGVSYAPRLPGPDGQVVLLTTPRTAPPPARSHTDSPMLNYIYDARSSAHKHMHHSQRFGPMFETNTTSITVQIGSTASIDCKISLLQDNAVSLDISVGRLFRKEASRLENCSDVTVLAY